MQMALILDKQKIFVKILSKTFCYTMISILYLEIDGFLSLKYKWQPGVVARTFGCNTSETKGGRSL